MRTSSFASLLLFLSAVANALTPVPIDSPPATPIEFELRVLEGSRLGAKVQQHATLRNGSLIVPCLRANAAAQVRIEMWFEGQAPVNAWPDTKGSFRKLERGQTCLGDGAGSSRARFEIGGRAGENGVRIIQQHSDGSEAVIAGITFFNAEAVAANEILVTKPSSSEGPPQSGTPTLQACNPPARVVGGNDARAGEYPWMVSLRASNDSQQCGGSLITPQWVLTAAHCFGSDPKNLTIARHGALIDSEGTRYEIEKVEVHPRYPNRSDVFPHDIALVKLTKPVPLSKVGPDQLSPLLALAPANADKALTPPQLCADVIGWGRLGFGLPISPALQKLRVPLWDANDCRRMSAPNHSAMYQIDDRGQICAGYVEGKRDSCSGDSGGPLVIPIPGGDWLQIGIVSYGFECARKNAPGVYTRVSHYRSWIDCVLAGGNVQSCDQP